MKILLIIPELGNGGAEQSILKLSEYLAIHHDVFLCVFHTQVKVSYPVSVDLINLQTPPTIQPLRKLYYIFSRIRAIRKVKRKLDIDVSISFLEGADYLNVLTKGTEKVVTSLRGSKSHDQEISGWLGKLRRKVLIPWLYRKSDRIVTVSEMLAQEMHKDYRISEKLMTTIPNFYDIEEIARLASEPLPSAYQDLFLSQIVVHSGRFHPQKEHKALITVFSRVKQQLSVRQFTPARGLNPSLIAKPTSCLMPIRLVLLGDGDLKPDLIQHALSSGLKVCDATTCQTEMAPDADVYLLGFQQNPFQFIARAALFAFPSSWEGFPNALAEAMICGVPVVSADCPTGPRELLAPDSALETYAEEPEETPYGWLMPLLKDEVAIDQWVKVICKSLTEPTAAKVQVAQKRMEAFSREKVMQHWFEIIGKDSSA